MNKILQSSKFAWQRERANRLHRICLSITTRVEHGEKRRKLVGWFAWYWRGRSYRCDPARPLNISVSTIKRALGIWKRGGQVAAALLPRYTPRKSVFTSPVLIRFLNFISQQPQPSMKAAWEKFCGRGGNAGCGRRAGKPLTITYGQLQYSFPAKVFAKIRAQQKAIENAEAELGRIKIKAVAEIEERFPARPPRRRVKREIYF